MKKTIIYKLFHKFYKSFEGRAFKEIMLSGLRISGFAPGRKQVCRLQFTLGANQRDLGH